MHRGESMDTRRLDESSRLVGATSWAAIASGVFIALALQTLLLLFGLAVGLSVGDKAVAGGYALWAVIVQLLAIAVGAALAGRLSHANHRMGGIVAGIMTWAVALALGGTLTGATLGQRFASMGAWAGFVGALLGLGAAIVGGAVGSTLGGRGRTTTTTTTGTTRSDIVDQRVEPFEPTTTHPAL
jgi:hypothetical protein